jgi:transcriptional regulator with XRE-family HTH domain
MKTYGELLRLLRRSANKSLEDLAEVANCSISYVSQVERGLKNPPPDEVTATWSHLLCADDRLEELITASRTSVRRWSFSTEGKSERATSVLTALARRYEANQLSEDEIAELEKCINKEKEGA